MAQIKPTWVEIDEFGSLANKIIAKFPERFGKLDVSEVVAYACKNKERPSGKAKLYEMKGESEPECFTNTKRYFIKMFLTDWEIRDESQKLLIIASALSRIDPDNPGKVAPLDYRDQSVMLRTFGPDWAEKDNVPNILQDQIEFKD